MIDLNKKYKTQGGYPVILYDIVDTKVFGRWCKNGHWYSCDWFKETGRLFAGTSNLDLVEVPEFSIISHNIKKVKYFDIELTVPTWVKWIAVNATGEIQLFDDVPDVPEISLTQWIKMNHLGKFRYLPVNVGYTGDWKKSLQEV